MFSGVGKLKSKQVTLASSETSRSAAKANLFNLPHKAERKVKEEVDGPTPCVNPVVIIPGGRQIVTFVTVSI